MCIGGSHVLFLLYPHRCKSQLEWQRLLRLSSVAYPQRLIVSSCTVCHGRACVRCGSIAVF